MNTDECFRLTLYPCAILEYTPTSWLIYSRSRIIAMCSLDILHKHFPFLRLALFTFCVITREFPTSLSIRLISTGSTPPLLKKVLQFSPLFRCMSDWSGHFGISYDVSVEYPGNFVCLYNFILYYLKKLVIRIGSFKNNLHNY